MVNITISVLWKHNININTDEDPSMVLRGVSTKINIKIGMF